MEKARLSERWKFQKYSNLNRLQIAICLFAWLFVHVFV